jgi:hypothetical protein
MDIGGHRINGCTYDRFKNIKAADLVFNSSTRNVRLSVYWLIITVVTQQGEFMIQSSLSLSLSAA